MIKYGEIGIKGDNRHLFEDALAKRIRTLLKRIDG
jgi:thiamine biosynthesis protein ThiI